MTTYRLLFLPSARKEWDALDGAVRDQFKRKLIKRLAVPHNPASRLSEMPGCYKIKLRSAGYRLVYRVDDGKVTVVVIAIGRRDRNAVYKAAVGRL